MPTVVFQSCFGPSAGHEADQPVSFEIPLKSLPRQRGQSLAAAGDTAKAHRIEAAMQAVGRTENRARNHLRRAASAYSGLSMAAQLTHGNRSVKHWRRVPIPPERRTAVPPDRSDEDGRKRAELEFRAP